MPILPVCLGKYGLMLAVQQYYQEIPDHYSSNDVLRLVHKNIVDGSFLQRLKELSLFSDEQLASFLHLNVKTYRAHRNAAVPIRRDLQEHTVMLLSVVKHGIDVFGSGEAFKQWVFTDNYFLDNAQPATYLDTINGIKFIHDRLSAMEYGDNV